MTTPTPTVEAPARPRFRRLAIAGVIAWLTASYAMAAWFLMAGQAPMSFLVDPGPLLLAAFVPFYGLAQGWAPLTGAGIAWAILHRLRWTTPLAGTAVGALAGAAAPFCANAFPMVQDGDPQALALFRQMTVVTTLIGAAVGLMTWRIAYRGSADPGQP